MRVVNRVFGGETTSVTYTSLAAMCEELPARYMYDLLRAYYLGNGLYDVLRSELAWVGASDQALKPLRNPAHRVVEFYAAKLWPGPLPDALPIVTENNRIVAPIRQVWTWSNWAAQKQVAARWLALYGNLFVKVVQNVLCSRVYFQLIDARHVTEFEGDERGFLTYVRLDIPQEERRGGEVESAMHTEVWDRDAGTYRRWRHQRPAGTDLGQLGPPAEERWLAEFGIDFVPFVHAKHRDIGEERGLASFELEIDKIDEANRMATRLHQMLFRHNRVLWALQANMVDAAGRPIPPPLISGSDGASDAVDVGDDVMYRLPGMASLQPLVPQLNYEAALQVLQDHMLELERDLPELAYYRLRDMDELSGRAVRLLLSDTIDRALEVRGNAEAALARADQMALTLGARAGLFRNVGTYEAGDFEHSFRERDVVPRGEYETAETANQYVQAGTPLRTALRRQGWTDADLEQMEEDREAESAAAQTQLAGALLEAQRRFDQESRPADDSEEER